MYQEYQEMRRTAEPPKSVKLYYFDISGRAQAVRAILAVGGVEFEDIRLAGPEWGKFKPTTPFGGMPVLDIDGKMIAQSTTCARLAAKIGGLSGKSLMEEALSDSVVDTVVEIREKLIPLMFEKDEEKKAKALADAHEKYLPETLDKLERFVSDHNDGAEGYFCGGEMTWADISFVVHLGMLDDMKMLPASPAWDEGRPKLKALDARVRADPRFKAYQEKAKK